MGYRIRVAPEVQAWLAELRVSDPAAAGLVDGALELLREGRAVLRPPLVVSVDWPPYPRQPGLDEAYRRQLEALTRARRGVADVATARKRLELQVEQHEQAAAKLADQIAHALEVGREDVAAEARSRASEVTGRLDSLRRLYVTAQSDESRAQAASMGLQAKIDDLRVRQEAVRAAQAAAEAADTIARAEELIEGPGPGTPDPPGPTRRTSAPPELRELRPGAPARTGIRILFTVQPPDTVVLLGAGTERDWLSAWYAEAILLCQDRYERDQGSTG